MRQSVAARAFAAARAVLLLSPWLAWVLVADAFISLLLPLKPIAPSLTYNLSSRLAESVWAWIQLIFVRLNGASITVRSRRVTKSSTIDTSWSPREESAVVIANHSSWADFYLIQEVAQQAGMLSRCRWFAKRALRWVPFLGWGLWAMGMPLVSRRWASDRAELDHIFGGIVKHKLPVWLISYSEGTRCTPAKRAAAASWCETHSKPLPKHLLYPRARGFVATVNALRRSHHVHAVYDLTLAYARGTRFMQAPSFWETVATPDLGAAGWRFYVGVDRFEIADLPEDDDALARWLEERWLEKGEHLDRLRANVVEGKGWPAG